MKKDSSALEKDKKDIPIVIFFIIIFIF